MGAQLRCLGIVALLVALLAGCPAKTDGGTAPKVGQGAAEPEASKKAQVSRKKPGFFSRAIFAKPAFAYAANGAKEVSISDVAERCVRSVVNVRSTREVPRARMPFPFESPFGGPPPARRARSLGSGVILSADGVVLTNHHVVSKSGEIRVTLSDEREFEAEIVGSDSKADLALLRIKAPPKDLVPLEFGDSNKLRLGEVVLAIGNPFGVGQTVTMGIVSAKGRANMGIVDYEDFIQTDAAINPGNSGGALVSMRGKLVGINTAILSKTGGYQGIGFAIPSKMAQPIMRSLLKHGRVIRGWLGVVIQTLSKEMAPVLKVPVDHGVLVSQVQADSPAAKAGIRRGDVIVELDGKKMKSVTKLRNVVALKGAGVKVKLALYRTKVRREVSVTLGELPGERGVAVLGGAAPGTLGGMTVAPVDGETRRNVGLPRDVGGVVVRKIDHGSSAFVAGIRPGDVIIEINRQPVRSAGQFARAYREAKTKLLLLLFRRGGAMYMMLDK